MGQPARRADVLFKALADPSRRKILRLLASGDLPLHRIELEFRMSRPAVLKHIRLLKECLLVRVEKKGRETIHRLDARPLKRLHDWVEALDAFWGRSLLALKHQVEADR
ncbi:MAG TPA: metalloregulator ArsR/SmtB family transcription factor [Planctomycetota bacterium]|nr:metalloregulator ArsR/SmtB family transcription factor [Planctomycetota bacterium]